MKLLNLVTLTTILPIVLATVITKRDKLTLAAALKERHDASEAVEAGPADYCYKPCWNVYIACREVRKHAANTLPVHQSSLDTLYDSNNRQKRRQASFLDLVKSDLASRLTRCRTASARRSAGAGPAIWQK